MALKEQQKKMIVGLFVAGIMIMSTFAFVLNYAVEGPSKIQYGDYEFRQTKQGYTTEIDGKKHTFFALPSDVDTLPISEQAEQLLNADMFTVIYDPNTNHSTAMAEVQFMLEQNLPGIDRALTNNTGTALPQKSCEDGMDVKPVILLQHAEESKITTEGNCIKAEFMDEYDLLREEELIRYYILGVLP